MKKLTIAALITLGLGGLTYTAMADRGPRLEAVDVNQDGNITKDELSAHRAERFQSADVNGDNLVSAEEFASFAEAERERKREQRQAKRFAKIDANGDGVITAEEHDLRIARDASPQLFGHAKALIEGTDRDDISAAGRGRETGRGSAQHVARRVPQQ